MSEPKAVVILIDNSSTSINGDFYPNRLDAQKLAAERLCQYYSRQSAKNQIGIGTMGSIDFGIAASLTTRIDKISKTIAKISRGGQCSFENGVKCAFLALHHRDPDLKERRVVVFIGSNHGLSRDTASKLSTLANREGAAVDIVAFGEAIDEMDILSDFVSQINTKSHFFHARSGTVILSDLVLSSPIGPGEGSSRARLDPSAEEDPEVALAIRQSLNSANFRDQDLEEAIRLSLMDNGFVESTPNSQTEAHNEENIDEMDPDIREAIQASLMDFDPSPQTNPQEKVEPQANDEIDENDPDIAAALEASLMENPEDGNSNQENIEDMDDILRSLPGVDPSDPIFKGKKDDEKDNKKNE